MLLAPLFGAPTANLARLQTCTVKMTDEQVAAILSLYLSEHPERWHEQAHGLMFGALNEKCPK
ncbi:MAG: hypothetical protein A3I61_13450 [Acidobacteria bacterium RIFCSPLOWO2_02_FULL_68_18]|nr:MAG: hypothetical protein A3I61_13450 [Acidobacteria bacterium RIFCSPLOWO2_02_FULL_68_18]